MNEGDGEMRKKEKEITWKGVKERAACACVQWATFCLMR